MKKHSVEITCDGCDEEMDEWSGEPTIYDFAITILPIDPVWGADDSLDLHYCRECVPSGVHGWFERGEMVFNTEEDRITAAYLYAGTPVEECSADEFDDDLEELAAMVAVRYHERRNNESE